MLMQFRRRRSRKKKILRWGLAGALLAVCLLSMPSVYEVVRSGYRDWKRDRALRQAKEFYAAQDYAKANTALQVALHADRRNIVVWKTIADMTEAAGAREAILQRQQVVLLAPTDHQAKVALAMTAMRFGDLLTARDALASVPENFRDATHYRRAVALFAMLEGNGSTAEQVIASLMRTDSSDNLRFSYLSVRLSHPDPVVASSSRMELAGMIETPAMAAAALRALMNDAIMRSDFTAAHAWVDRLVKLPEAGYNDKLALGTLQLLIDKKPLEEVLPPLVAEAGQEPGKMAELARWLLVQRQGARAQELIDGLSPEARESVLLKPVRVDLAIVRQDWAAVGELLRQGALGPISSDTVRLVMEARAVGELQGEEARFVQWGRAIDFSRTNIFGLRILYRLGVTWKWGREVEATLLAIARGFPGQTWAHEALVRVYTVEKNAAGLRQIFGIWSQQAVGVPRIKHDAALMELLVLGPTAPAHVLRTAEEFHKNDPTNNHYATTRALACVYDNRIQEAVRVVEAMPDPAKKDPARAPYLAFIYAKARKGDLCREQLALVRPSALLKEEQALADQARAMLDKIDAEMREINQLVGRPDVPPKPASSSEAGPKR
jgi:hypothetical protein